MPILCLSFIDQFWEQMLFIFVRNQFDRSCIKLSKIEMHALHEANLELPIQRETKRNIWNYWVPEHLCDLGRNSSRQHCSNLNHPCLTLAFLRSYLEWAHNQYGEALHEGALNFQSAKKPLLVHAGEVIRDFYPNYYPDAKGITRWH